jgi:hypothetical protein
MRLYPFADMRIAQTCKLIACATVIEEMLPFMPPGLTYEVLDFGLHSNPDQLRQTLQRGIDICGPATATVLLGFGLCAKAAAGLQSGNRTIVIPKADDCITIFLGSEEHYRQQQRNEPGTLYLTKGWIESGTPLDEQRSLMARKYGNEKAEFLFKKMLQGYKRLAYINTGNYELERYRIRSREIARRLGLRYEEIEGDSTLVKKMLSGLWDDDFVVAPPGHTISLSDFGKL